MNSGVEDRCGDRNGVSDVIVIGAGPAGLSLAHQLSLRGLSVSILEREKIASTWRKVPTDLTVLSPWWTNVLELRHVFRVNPLRRVKAKRYRDYLLNYATEKGLVVHEGIEIVDIRRRGGVWSVMDASCGEWLGQSVVCATGYFSRPNRPAVRMVSDNSVPAVHASEIEDYDRFTRETRGYRILLVGKRVTAGQMMIELVNRGFEVAISADSPIQFRRSGLLAWLYEQLYFFYEALRLRLQPRLVANSYPAMQGGNTERWLAAGRVRVVGKLVRVLSDAVELDTGERIRVDSIIFATGYRPSLNFLQGICTLRETDGLPKLDGFEVRGAKGVYLLGFDNLRNFRSRYLRGIRSDAKVLADIIGARANSRGAK